MKIANMVSISLMILITSSCTEEDGDTHVKNNQGNQADESNSTDKIAHAENIDFQFIDFRKHDVAGRQARIRISNKTVNPIKVLRLDLIYKDKTGNIVSTFPWSISEHPYYLDAGESTIERVGADIPRNVESIDVSLKEMD